MLWIHPTSSGVVNTTTLGEIIKPSERKNTMVISNQSTKLLIKKTLGGINDGKETDFFIRLINELMKRTVFYGMKIGNDVVFRVRPLGGELFKHTNDLKYPPIEFCKKGRLNSEYEQIAYLSISEIAPITEFNFDFFDIYCVAKIKIKDKDSIFHCAGMKADYSGGKADNRLINKFFRDIFNTKGPNCYNATNALGKYFLYNDTLTKNGQIINSGLIYTAVNQEMSNQQLYNLAVTASAFDENFEIVGAEYNMLVFDKAQDSIIIETINKATINEEGNISWEFNRKEMLISVEEKYCNKTHLMGENSIVSYKYGSGKIIKEFENHYVVSFRNGEKVILKSDINIA